MPRLPQVRLGCAGSFRVEDDLTGWGWSSRKQVVFRVQFLDRVQFRYRVQCLETGGVLVGGLRGGEVSCCNFVLAQLGSLLVRNPWLRNRGYGMLGQQLLR